jgi:hypothetical protein
MQGREEMPKLTEKLAAPEICILTILLGISHCQGRHLQKLGAEIRNGIP